MNAAESARLPESEQLTIASLLSSGLRAAGTREIVTRDGLRLGYPAFAQRVHRLAHALVKLGVRPGSKVAIMDVDGHRYLEAYFAVPMLGAALMTVNIRLSPEQIRYTLEHSESELVLINADLLDGLAATHTDACLLRGLIVMGRSAVIPPSLLSRYEGEYEALLDAADTEFRFPFVDEHAVATLFYTTGTTGLPKGVWYTHRQLVIHTLSLGTALGCADSRQSLRVGDVYMPLTPMFHVHAWGMPYLATMLGLKQVYAGRYEAAAILALRKREGVSFSHCVPTILQMLLDVAGTPDSDLSGWKLMIGGSSLAPTLARAALDRGASVFAGYGMSETGPVLTFARLGADDDEEKYRCAAGQPLPLVDLRMQSESGEIIEQRDGNTRGELVARAPWLTAGYHRNEAASRGLWEGGYLHTNDVVTFSGTGAVRIVDRLKDVIKTGGEWVSSLEVENRIRESCAVGECAVIGLPHPKWGERPVAYVTIVAGSVAAEVEAAIRESLAAHVAAGRMSRFAVPDTVVFVDEIPKTSVGKFDKRRLRERAALKA